MHEIRVAESALTLPDGRRVAYAEQGPPSDAAVVLVHGWPDSWRAFEPVLSALPDDVWAIAPSLPGFGTSDALPGEAGPDQLAATVTAVADAIGVSRATLVGHSLGTLVIQRIALERPELAAGLVMIGGFSRLGDDVSGEIWSAVADLDDPIDEGFVREFQSSTLAAPVPDDFFEQLVAESLLAPADVWRSTFAGLRDADHRRDVAAIIAPTMLLWGEHDGLVPFEHQQELLRVLPDATLEIYAGAGHSPNWEQPERVAADVVRVHRRTAGRPHVVR